MTKYILSFLFAFGVLMSAHGQAPYINSISPTSASVGDVINISGSNLTGVTIVFFGGARGSNVTVVNSTLVTAQVPFGATFDQITVLHTTNDVAGYSAAKFNLSFDGQSISDGSTVAASLSTQETFATSKTQTQDLCNCDFDNDGDLDVAVSNAGSNDILIFTNTSTVGNVDFTPTPISNSFPVTNVVCGDLDGDGFSDLVANELGGEGKVYTYRNDQAGSFEAREELSIPKNGSLFRIPGRLAIGDLNLDGKPEIAVTAEDANLVFFFENNSTSGDISMVSTPVSLSADENSGSAGLGGLDIADMNNDGLPEIIASNFTGIGFYVFQNNSQPNSFTFKTPTYTSTNSSIRTLAAGDMDQDGFMDVVLTNSDISSSDIIEISENATSIPGSDISMTAPISILGINTSWGLDLGDIDGDGDLDIAVGSFGSNNGFYVILNTNPASISSSSYSVGLVAESNAKNSRNIKIADIDADGRPDLVYTNNSTAEGTGNLATRLNDICYTPVIRPTGSTILCQDESVSLIAPTTGYITGYTWKRGTTTLAETSNTLTITEGITSPIDGDYTVIIADGCSTVSSSITVSAPGTAYDAPTISSTDNSPCEGGNITLNIDTEGAGTNTYFWTGPNGFTSTEKNPIINGITASQSGEYNVSTSMGAGCQKQALTPINLLVTSLPIVSVNNSKSDSFCNGTTLTLSTNVFAGYTYDWKKNEVSTGGTDPASELASSNGDYSVTISDGSCSYTSVTRTLSTVIVPTSAFTASDTEICEAVAVDFTAASSGDNSLSLVNHWNYGDGSEETGNTTSHAFSTAGDKTVMLTAKYEGIDDGDCPYVAASEIIKVVAPPSGDALDLIISDNSDTNNFEKCSDSELTLRVEDTYTNYVWKTGTTTISTISIAEVLEEIAVFVTLTNDVKCTFDSDPVNVTNYTTGGIEITASSPNSITEDIDLGKIINLEEGQTSVTLSVSNTEAPAWEPALYINDTTLTTVEVTATSKQLIKVSGLDALGCQEKDSVTLIVPGVQADKSFTPNGDGIGDCWEVSNVGSTDCQVVIFDSKGRRIREISFNADGGADDCVWDGNKSNGSSLPDGMYYYFISCSDSGNESSGSIFMAR